MKALSKFQKAAKKKTKPSNNRTTAVKVNGKLSKLIDKFAKANLAFKEVKSEMDAIADQLRPKLAKEVEDQLKKGVKINSLKFEGGEHVVMVVLQDKWSYITDEQVARAKKILGKKEFEELVEPEVILKVKPDEEKMEELAKILGDRLEEFFDVEVRYKPKKGFLNVIYSRYSEEKIRKIRQLFNHSTPHLRVVA